MSEKVKIKSVSRYDNKDDFGNWTFKVNLEDGRMCYYKTKEENQTTYKVGEEVIAVIEQKIKKDGAGTYYTIKPEKPVFGAKVGYSKDHKKESVTMCLSYAKDLCMAGKITTDQTLPLADKFYAWVTAKLAE